MLTSHIFHVRRAVVALVFAFALAPLTAHSYFIYNQFPTDVCPFITYDMVRGATDAKTGGQVSKLQQFLFEQSAFSGEITGYFGPVTEKAVRTWQERIGFASNLKKPGTVGPQTRSEMNALCVATGGAVAESELRTQLTVLTALYQELVKPKQTAPTNITASYCPQITLELLPGDNDSKKSNQISALQRFLANRYGINESDVVTGFYGDKTTILVVRFQREMGLEGLGGVGPKTRAALATCVVR